MTRREGTLSPAYFEELYASDPDPWRFATSDYEREKYAATLAALSDGIYRSGLEIGCSIGVMTRRLAAHCERLLSLDVAAGALDQAKARCADLPQVAFDLMFVPKAWPDGRYDLILLSEVVYYLDPADVARLAVRVGGSSLAKADIVLVHWLGLTDFPMEADAAVDLFIARSAGLTRIVRQSRTAQYRLDVLRVTGDPSDEGL